MKQYGKGEDSFAEDYDSQLGVDSQDLSGFESQLENPTSRQVLENGSQCTVSYADAESQSTIPYEPYAFCMGVHRQE